MFLLYRQYWQLATISNCYPAVRGPNHNPYSTCYTPSNFTARSMQPTQQILVDNHRLRTISGAKLQFIPVLPACIMITIRY